ncbi:MAG TPA: uL30 family ribosomal protein [Thermoplasmata archaeon]|nr:uL30 family ribosomal protein [Thermoplasmata archaeon]
MTWMVIRVRGSIHARSDIVETLHALHLTRPNHATIVPEAPSYRGMLTKVQGYVTWGEADRETVAALLAGRGERPDGGRLGQAEGTEALVGPVTESGLGAAPGLRPVLRLKAPTGGWRSTKKPFGLGGALGYRGAAINDLARRML